jgi:hypothetical protein
MQLLPQKSRLRAAARQWFPPKTAWRVIISIGRIYFLSEKAALQEEKAALHDEKAALHAANGALQAMNSTSSVDPRNFPPTRTDLLPAIVRKALTYSSLRSNVMPRSAFLLAILSLLL